MIGMAKKKPAADGKKPTGRNLYPGFQLRLHPKMRAQLEALAERNFSNMTDEIRIAIRKHLESVGMWPPPPPPTAQ
jgi:hypothetical protein